MKYTYLLIIIPLVALNNNTIEILTDKGYSASQIMFYRGAFSASLIALFSIVSKRNYFPKNWKPQAGRMAIDGLSVFLLYTSYKYLSAGTVALVQRMDIPLLIIISIFNKQTKSSLQFYLSIWSIFVLAFFFFVINT